MRTVTLFVSLVLAVPLAAAAQEIAVKSIPVATGTQFMIFPSENLSMGGVTIALDDPLHDPFVNPAKGIRVRGMHFAGTPSYYSVNHRDGWVDDASSARTLPIGMVMRSRRIFGGAVLAWQEMNKRDTQGCCWIAEDALSSFVHPSDLSIQQSDGSINRNNVYLFAFGGSEISGTNLSVGVSAFAANLNGIEGVRLLYAQGDQVDQDGEMQNVKVGLLQRWDDGRSAELTAQWHRFKMDHAMTHWIWLEDVQRSEPVTRIEQDHTSGVALRAGYRHPMKNGWEVGAILVGDWKTHPKIPNYDLMRIPRDPGNSSAYNIGVGFARRVGRATYGFDLIYEPIWSHTWANAVEDITRDDEVLVRAGEMTVENYFRFRNAIFRMGARHAGKKLEFGVGLNLHVIGYQLNQYNFVERFKREQDESWGEWTLTTGLGYNFTAFRMQYLSLVTLGTGRPGIDERTARAESGFFDASADFIVAPHGSLALADAVVWTHRVSLLIPLSQQ